MVWSEPDEPDVGVHHEPLHPGPLGPGGQVEGGKGPQQESGGPRPQVLQPQESPELGQVQEV